MMGVPAQHAGAGMGMPGMAMPPGMAGLQALQGMFGAPAGQRRMSMPQAVKEKLAFSCWAEKQGGIVKSWKKRFFALSNRTLKYYSSPDEATPKGTIVLANIQSVNKVSTSAANIGLVLQTPSRGFLLRFDNDEARTLMADAVQGQIDIIRAPKTPGSMSPASTPLASPASSVQAPSFSAGSSIPSMPTPPPETAPSTRSP